ncbi:MAG: hypothetical protein JWO87_2351 [Phycisphaerales bacterium]|nr:hypothetical protein [Phycisphaerales bacterium]
MNVSRVLAGMLLLLPAAFCAFGFLATFEQSPHAMLFRVGYAVAGLGLLAAAVNLFVRAAFSRTRTIPAPSPAGGFGRH